MPAMTATSWVSAVWPMMCRSCRWPRSNTRWFLPSHFLARRKPGATPTAPGSHFDLGLGLKGPGKSWPHLTEVLARIGIPIFLYEDKKFVPYPADAQGGMISSRMSNWTAPCWQSPIWLGYAHSGKRVSIAGPRRLPFLTGRGGMVG